MIFKLTIYGPEGPRDAFVSGTESAVNRLVEVSGWGHRLRVDEVHGVVPRTQIDYILPLSDARLVRDLKTSKLVHDHGQA